MKSINRKLIRDLGSSKWLFAGVSLVIFLGVAFFGASYMAFQNLKGSYDYSYEALHFADFTISVSDAPQQTVQELKAVSGVQNVVGRLNVDIPLRLPGDSNITVLARAISLPAPSRATVDDVKVEAGSYLAAPDQKALLVEKSFADYHKLSPGDKVSLIVNGQDVALDVAGIVTSPEYIFAAKSRQEVLISPQVFGVVFVPEQTLATLTNRQAINEFCVTVVKGADATAVLQEAENTLSSYNILDVVPRDEQPSNAALKLDLQEFGELADIFPVLFLVIGALATYILLTRMVQNQRPQIGLMRALGYSRRTVLFHYLSFALVVGVAGSVAGTVAGYFLSGAVTSLYITILGLPFTVISPNWMAIEEGIAIGILPSIIAGILPALAASRLMPAEAMHPPAPPTGRTPLLERLLPFLKSLPYLWKMPLRNLFRSRNRSLSIVIGVAFGVSLILVSAAFIDSVSALLDLQFQKIQKYDARIDFSTLEPESLVAQVSGWSEVGKAEPVLQVPVRMEYAGATYSTILVGLRAGSELLGIYDTAGSAVDVSPGSILMGDGLRKELGVQTGDTIDLQTSFGSGQSSVAGFVKQPLGSLGYVSLATAQAITSQPAINGIMLSLRSQDTQSIRDKVTQELPGASVEVTSETKAVVTSLFDLIDTIMLIMLAFGAALALVIVSTMVTLSILERRREVATMRTIGETKGRIGVMITIENILLGIAGLIPGIVLGYALALYLFTLFQTDMFSFDLVIFARTYLLATGLIILIVLISQMPGIRHVNRLDLARVIKEQER